MKKLVCLLVIIALSLVGCGEKAVAPVKNVPFNSVPLNSIPVVEPLSPDLITVSELTINKKSNVTTEIMGTATNNNKKECNFDFDVIFINPNGTPLTTETIQVNDIKPGEVKYFKGTTINTDVSKATHKVQFGEFYTYTKTE